MISTLTAAVTALQVYRTYIDAANGSVADADRTAIAAAVQAGMTPPIASYLTLSDPSPKGFVTRFQQTTPAIMAKCVEDTASYRYLRLLALNDVGGDPGRFGLDVEAFHDANAARAQRHPEGLLTTMTHDAKRSHDVRARIGALSQIPDEFVRETDRFMDLTAAWGGPDDQERYLIFQTLVGASPIPLDRVTGYVQKALREAKRTTNWLTPDVDHEQAVTAFLERLYAANTGVFNSFFAGVTQLGQRSALSQLALKLTSPGVPDTYQGDELGYRALVDPDNRRQVNWRARDALLRRLMGGGNPGRDQAPGDDAPAGAAGPPSRPVRAAVGRL
jgi:(1->4)-alpha-D-glucan 1-alpha-D-glucosylmutase